MLRQLILPVALLSLQVTLCQDNFREIFNSSINSSRQDIKIEFTDSQNNQTFLPISIIKGKLDGPVFTIVAGVHGFEYPPIMAVQKLLGEIDENELSGTLIIIPIANTGSFYTRTPFMNPQDKVNLNNAFPGRSTGTVTQKIAHFMTTNIIPVSDVFLDIHGGGAPEDLLPFICYYDNQNHAEQTKKAKELSEGSGFEYVVSYPYTLKETDPAKYVFKQACQDGKVALSIESGKLGNVQPEAITLAKNAVYRMLDMMNMYSKTLPELKKEIITLNDQRYIKANEQGIFYSTLQAGDTVRKGEIVGYITDVFGNRIAEYETPVSGIILYKISTPPVNTDDTLMCISVTE